jgi:transcriptional regulator with XRE-family HTH domain
MVFTPTDKTFGDAIRTARLAKGWNQTEAGREIGCSYSSVSLYESDKQVPTMKRIQKICEVYGLDLAEMAQLAFGKAE